MSFLTLSQVKIHLRIDGTDSDADLTGKIAAAEVAAINDLQCNVYADQNALDAAIAAVPATLAAAKEAFDAACAAAYVIDDLDAYKQALSVYSRSGYAATRTRNGVVINDLIIAAMLLIVGWLYENREDGAEIPKAARDLLSAYRCYA